MTQSKVRERTQRFTSLRAAQRALARIVHPAVLADVREQGRELLIELQSLSERRDSEGLDFGQVDSLLERQTSQTLELIGRLEFSQLQAAASRLCLDHPEEVRALIDVLCEGDLSRDKNLRLLEYMVTMLSVEEWNGRRTLVKEPSDLTASLRDISRRSMADPSIDAQASESFFEDAMARMIRGKDLRDIRDEVRAYKESLGRRALHPRILSLVVTYNVAMWNQVAARIDGDNSVDQLAEELLADLPVNESQLDTVQRPKDPARDTNALSSSAFDDLLTAFGNHVRGQTVANPALQRIVKGASLDGLRPIEVEALEADDPDPVTQLVRRAVVLGRLLRHAGPLRDALETLGLDPQLLERETLPELTREMTASGRKLFLDSRYDDAFTLSEVKTRNLASFSPRLGGEGSNTGNPALRKAPIVAAKRHRVEWNLTPGRLGAIVGGLLGIALLAITVSPLNSGVAIVSSGDLDHVSPFLDSGRRHVVEGREHFVGELGATWAWLGTPEREEVANEIGDYYAADGVEVVVLRSVGNVLAARWEDGELSELMPRRER